MSLLVLFALALEENPIIFIYTVKGQQLSLPCKENLLMNAFPL